MNSYKILLYCILFLTSQQTWAQRVYLDPTVTAAMTLYSIQLDNAQEETIEEQSRLQQAQTWVAGKLAVANHIQDKIYRGLSEVSGTLTNGLQVQQIYAQLNRCTQYSQDIADLTATHPRFAVFGAQAIQKSYEQAIKIGTEASQMLEGGELNLATAGDRYKLLKNVLDNVVMLKIWLLQTKLNIQRAARLGFWQSINPFQTYINTDLDIVENIMYQYQHRF